MADKKISELDAITGANTAATDVFVVVDTSTGQTKKITREELNNAIEQDVLSSIDIDTINGDFSVNGNINLGDNNKAIFGAGSDLQIYHDGSNSIVKDNGTGNLELQGSSWTIVKGATSGTWGIAHLDGAQTNLYHNGSLKLATTSTGIDVTGTVTATSISVGDSHTIGNDGFDNLEITSSTSENIVLKPAGSVYLYNAGAAKLTTTSTGIDVTGTVTADNYLYLGSPTGSAFEARSEDSYVTLSAQARNLNYLGNRHIFYGSDFSERMRITSDGSVGIGVTSPDKPLHVNGGTLDAVALFESSDVKGGIILKDSTTTAAGGVGIFAQGDNATIYTDDTERLRITDAGLVGIGTASPAGELEVNSAGDSDVYIRSGDTNAASIYFGSQSDSQEAAIRYYNSNNSLRFFGHDMAEAMRLDSSGRLGIGTTSPQGTLHIVNSGLANQLRVSNTTADATTKYGTVLGSHYTNSEEPITGMLLTSSSSSTGGSVSIGGGVSSANAVNTIKFYTAANNTTLTGTERARLDASGNLLVGKTTNTLATAGIALRGDVDVIQATRSNGDALNVNRLASDGSLIGLYKDTVEVGKIGTAIGNAYFAGSSTGITFGSANVYPTNASGTKSDGTLTLGSSSNRFDDLYLGGVAYISDGTSSGTQTVVGGNYYIANSGAYPIVFQTNSAERMRITSGGGIGIGTSSPTGAFHLKTIRYDNYPIFQTTSDSNTPFFINFQKTDGTTIGSIRMTGTTGVAFNTTSDYRLKENVTGISDGIERVKQLNPSRFNFISDAGITVDGFLAHEAQTVVPQAVTGEKDAVDEDGNPEYQSIDHSKLVPLLTAALQEAIAKIEDLEARVATLEGN